MKQLKKILWVAGMIILIILACFGIGFAGGVPVPPNRRKDNFIEINIELKDNQEDEGGTILYNDCF